MSSLFPPALARRIGQGQSEPVEVYPEVTALAVELDGMDTVAVRGGPDQLREELAGACRALEGILADQPVERLWVGGRTLLIVAGGATPCEDHAGVIGEMALRLTHELAGRAGALRVGLGVHTGTAVAGAVGTDSLVCGIWGDAIDIAQGLARENPTGYAQISSAAYARMYEGFTFENQGVVEIGVRGQMRVYRLVGTRVASRA